MRVLVSMWFEHQSFKCHLSGELVKYLTVLSELC